MKILNHKLAPVAAIVLFMFAPVALLTQCNGPDMPVEDPAQRIIDSVKKEAMKAEIFEVSPERAYVFLPDSGELTKGWIDAEVEPLKAK